MKNIFIIIALLFSSFSYASKASDKSSDYNMIASYMVCTFQYQSEDEYLLAAKFETTALEYIEYVSEEEEDKTPDEIFEDISLVIIEIITVRSTHDIKSWCASTVNYHNW